jgi:TPR repeat protein
MVVDRVTMKKMMKKKNLSKIPHSDSIFFRTMKARHPIHGAIIALSLAACSSLYATEQTPTKKPDQAQPALNDPEALFQQARAFLHGYKVPRDPAKSIELMRAAAEQGHADAIGGVGFFYINGITVEKNEKEAALWFRRGAEKGSAKSQFNLAKILLEEGKSTGEESAKKHNEVISESLHWLKKSADQGFPDAALVYGSIFYFGEHGVDKDYEKAANYIKIAAEYGISEAQNTFGLMNQLGLGMKKDIITAEMWFRKAALQGHLKAQSNLGRILNPLADDKAIRIQALSWLALASNQGEITATKSLEDIVPTLKEGEFNQAKQEAVALRRLITKQPKVDQ